MTTDQLLASLQADQAALGAVNADIDALVSFVNTLKASQGSVPPNVEAAANSLASFLTTVQTKADADVAAGD